MADPNEPDLATQLQFIIDSPLAWAGTKCKAQNLRMLLSHPNTDQHYVKRWVASTIKALADAQVRVDAGLPAGRRQRAVSRAPLRKPPPQFPAWMKDPSLLPKRPPGHA